MALKAVSFLLASILFMITTQTDEVRATYSPGKSVPPVKAPAHAPIKTPAAPPPVVKRTPPAYPPAKHHYPPPPPVLKHHGAHPPVVKTHPPAYPPTKHYYPPPPPYHKSHSGHDEHHHHHHHHEHEHDHHHHAHPPKTGPVIHYPPVKAGPPFMAPKHGGNCDKMCEEDYCQKDRKKRACMKLCTACCDKSKCIPDDQYNKKCSWNFAVKLDGKMTKCPLKY